MKQLVMVSTPLPPYSCGMGSHTAMLRQFWPTQVQVQHLVTEGATATKAAWGVEGVYQFTPKSFLQELENLPQADLWIQYTGRAYHAWGCPLWLPSALETWRQRHPRQILGIMFHELWGEVPWWRKQYLPEILHRRVVQQLMTLADVVYTNSQHHAQRLEALVADKAVHWTRVGSNILPTQAVQPNFSQRLKTDFLLFGVNPTRVSALSVLGDVIRELHQAGILQHLQVVGPVDARWGAEEQVLLRELLPMAAVTCHGALAPEAISEILSKVGFALFAQPPESIEKSGSFMAFASHGCPVISPHAHALATAPLAHLIHPAELRNAQWENLTLELNKRTQKLLAWQEEQAGWETIVTQMTETFYASAERS